MKLKILPKLKKRSLDINVWNYLEDYSKNKKKILNIVDKVFKSGNLILSSEVKNLKTIFLSPSEVAMALALIVEQMHCK